MMKKTCGVLAASILLGLASSCSDENPWTGVDGKGAIRLSLTANGAIENAIPQTRAEGETTLFTVPEASDFNIHLSKTDGSWSRTYLHDDFINEKSFSTGSYRLRAYSGSSEKEGFDCPYFEGEIELNVLENKETVAEVTARIANSLVSVDYTEAFKDYMKSYSAGLHSAGGTYIEIPETETRPAFVNPGNVKLSVSFTNQQGQSVTIQPAEFRAEAAKHYHVTFNVNGGDVATPSLEVQFEDDLTVETVEIDLTDELFTSPAPRIDAVGFEDGAELEFLAGDVQPQDYKFNVLSYGGLKSVLLTLNVLEGDFKSGLNGDVELMGASKDVQDRLKALGIVCRGVFGNTDKMAVVDFTRLPSNLPAGAYELTLVAKDAFDRQSQPVSIRFTAVAPELHVTPQTALYGLNTGSLLINYNGSNPAEDITFKALSQYGTMKDAPVIDCIMSTRTRAIEGKNYLFTIQLPDTERTSIPVEVYLYGKLVTTVDLEVEIPEYTVRYDAFAKKVIFKVEADDDQVAVITENLKIYRDGSLVTANVSRDKEGGYITIAGLAPSQSYNFVVSLISATEGQKALSFTTEAATDIDNGNFADMQQTINIGRINAGGIYTYTFVLSGTYRNKTSIVVDTPTGWGNINNVTCDYDGSENKNTWYVVPSTLGNPSNGTVTVRTVGYSHNGPEPATWRATINNFYSQNAPDKSAFTVAAGQLFLGGNANTGAAFTTRPSGVTFNYAYAPVNNETAKVEVKVLSNGEVIGTGTTTFGSGSTGNVNISYGDNAFGKKATNLAIVFYSSSASAPEINIPSGAALNDNPKQAAPDADVTDRNNPEKNGSILNANTYNSKATGSELTLSNVTLNY